MALSAFVDPSHQPEPAELRKVLGARAALWKRLVAAVEERFAPITPEWTFSGAKYGWSLRLVRKKRVVLYLTPQDGGALVGIVLGGKAVEAVRRAGPPRAVLELVDAAPQYAEGRGVRLSIETAEDVDAVLTLAAAKMAN